jgi:hypothetical protein
VQYFLLLVQHRPLLFLLLTDRVHNYYTSLRADGGCSCGLQRSEIVSVGFEVGCNLSRV